MQKSMKERIWAQVKSVVLLLAVFMLTVSVTSAVYTFSPPTVTAPNGTYSVPLTTAKTAEWKWIFMSNDFNLSVNSQGIPSSSDPVNGKYGASQDSRYKEAVLSEKTLSFGDLLTTPSPFNLGFNNRLAGFFEANTRESGITGGRSWTVPAGLYDSQNIGYPTTTYTDWHGWHREDLLGDNNPASSDVLELFGTSTHGLDDQINVIKLSQATKFSPLPRFAIERTDSTVSDFDAVDPISLGGLRAGVVFADKGVIGLHVGPQPDESDDELTDPVLMAKINNHDTLNLEGHSNIGYGDTCQLFGKTAVTRGCPDGFYMVNYADDCHAKCRQMYYTDTNPVEYVNGRCSSTHGDMPDQPDYHTTPAANGPITAAELQGCGNIVTPPPVTGQVQADITPAGAITAGAQWQLDGTGPLYNSGQVVTTNLGSHFIKWTTVTGYTTPANTPVTVISPAIANPTGTYVPVASYSCTVQPLVGSKSFGAQVCLSSAQATTKTFSAIISGLYAGGYNTYGSHTATITIPAGQLCENSPQNTAVCTSGSWVGVQYLPAGSTACTLAQSLPSSVFSVIASSADSVPPGVTCSEL